MAMSDESESVRPEQVFIRPVVRKTEFYDLPGSLEAAGRQLDMSDSIIHCGKEMYLSGMYYEADLSFNHARDIYQPERFHRGLDLPSDGEISTIISEHGESLSASSIDELAKRLAELGIACVDMLDNWPDENDGLFDDDDYAAKFVPLDNEELARLDALLKYNTMGPPDRQLELPLR